MKARSWVHVASVGMVGAMAATLFWLTSLDAEVRSDGAVPRGVADSSSDASSADDTLSDQSVKVTERDPQEEPEGGSSFTVDSAAQAAGASVAEYEACSDLFEFVGVNFTDIPPANATAGSSSPGRKVPVLLLSRDTSYKPGCNAVVEQQALPHTDGASLRAFTIVVTTFRGGETLAQSVKTWRSSGLLSHPDFHEMVFHVNRCNCTDLAQIRDLMGVDASKGRQVRHRIVCSPGNIVHPLVLVRSMAFVRTPLTLLTENDRPILRLAGEDLEECVSRVHGFLDVAIRLVTRGYAKGAKDVSVWEPAHSNETDGSPVTPYVFLERQLQQRDDDYFTETTRRIERFTRDDERRVWGNDTKGPVQIWDKFYRVLKQDHERRKEWSDLSCWQACYFHRHKRPKSQTKHCLRVMKGNRILKRNPKTGKYRLQLGESANRWKDCDWRVCKEWLGWVQGRGDGLSGCWTQWMREQTPTPPLMKRIVAVIRPKGMGPVSCMRLFGWSNGPALFDTVWYKRKIAGTMCQYDKAAKDAGLVFQREKPHFGWYGRKMEYHLQFLSQKYMDGMVTCKGDGLMDHVELESYDNEPVAGNRQK
eukprot:Rhum_TRINITY_DN16547_c0_g1::Rhum_TRINITY_DN16547_c0_g1_i1::g.163601::m.163601